MQGVCRGDAAAKGLAANLVYITTHTDIWDGSVITNWSPISQIIGRFLRFWFDSSSYWAIVYPNIRAVWRSTRLRPRSSFYLTIQCFHLAKWKHIFSCRQHPILLNCMTYLQCTSVVTKWRSTRLCPWSFPLYPKCASISPNKINRLTCRWHPIFGSALNLIPLMKFCTPLTLLKLIVRNQHFRIIAPHNCQKIWNKLLDNIADSLQYDYN